MVKRYVVSWIASERKLGYAPEHEGPWVRYEDHAAEVERLKSHLHGCESNHDGCLDLLDAERDKCDKAERERDNAVFRIDLATKERDKAERERDAAVQLASEIFKHVPAPWGPSPDYDRMLRKRDEWREMLAKLRKEPAE